MLSRAGEAGTRRLPTRRWILAAPILAIVVLLLVIRPLSAAGDTGAADPNEGLRTLTETGLSASEARDLLDLQRRSDAVREPLAKLAGEKFGGFWFAPLTDGTMKMGVRASDYDASLNAAIERVLEEHGLRDETDIVPVRFSLSDLRAIQDAVDVELAELIKRSQIATLLRPDRNVVVVRFSDALASDERERIKAVADKFNGAVELHEVDPPALRFDGAACSVPFCDRPLRGGVRIGTEASICTAGFNARSRSDGKYFVLTAGHCLSSDPTTWQTRDSNLYLGKIGIRHNWMFGSEGDAGIVRNWSAFWYGPPYPTAGLLVPSSPDIPNANHDYGIGGVSTSSLDIPLCVVSGVVMEHGYYSDCGRVVGLNMTIQYGGASVNGLGILDSVCAASGTSGGPVFKNNRAYGIVVAKNPLCLTAYQGVTAAQNRLNVDVMTR